VRRGAGARGRPGAGAAPAALALGGDAAVGLLGQRVDALALGGQARVGGGERLLGGGQLAAERLGALAGVGDGRLGRGGALALGVQRLGQALAVGDPGAGRLEVGQQRLGAVVGRVQRALEVLAARVGGGRRLLGGAGGVLGGGELLAEPLGAAALLLELARGDVVALAQRGQLGGQLLARGDRLVQQPLEVVVGDVQRRELVGEAGLGRGGLVARGGQLVQLGPQRVALGDGLVARGRQRGQLLRIRAGGVALGGRGGGDRRFGLGGHPLELGGARVDLGAQPLDLGLGLLRAALELLARGAQLLELGLQLGAARTGVGQLGLDPGAALAQPGQLGVELVAARGRGGQLGLQRLAAAAELGDLTLQLGVAAAGGVQLAGQGSGAVLHAGQLGRQRLVAGGGLGEALLGLGGARVGGGQLGVEGGAVVVDGGQLPVELGHARGGGVALVGGALGLGAQLLELGRGALELLGGRALGDLGLQARFALDGQRLAGGERLGVGGGARLALGQDLLGGRRDARGRDLADRRLQALALLAPGLEVVAGRHDDADRPRLALVVDREAAGAHRAPPVAGQDGLARVEVAVGLEHQGVELGHAVRDVCGLQRVVGLADQARGLEADEVGEARVDRHVAAGGVAHAGGKGGLEQRVGKGAETLRRTAGLGAGSVGHP
jgi:hypothetical protein